MKCALVHDFLNQAGGAERVLGLLHRMFPAAPIYTTILDRDTLWPALRDAEIRTSFMQHLPGMPRQFRRYLPLYPLAVEGFDLRDYDLVISSSSAFAKAARARPDAMHLCYCYTPMRFVYQYDTYVERESIDPLSRLALPAVLAWLRAWDRRTSRRPDRYVAISRLVAERIRDCYGLPSDIVHPPVDTDRYRPLDEDRDYYLVVSRLTPYKRVDLAVRAFTELGLPLVVIGDGRDRAALQRIAGPTVRLLGHLPDDEVAAHYARCRGLVFPGVEDFGLTPLEANAAGRPVLAYAAGGAVETVIDGTTGVLFREQTVAALVEAVGRAETIGWDKSRLRGHAEGFGEGVFRRRFLEVLDRAWEQGTRRQREATARYGSGGSAA